MVDHAAWQRWLDEVSGASGARLEVVQRRLRVVDGHAVEPTPAAVAPTAATNGASRVHDVAAPNGASRVHDVASPNGATSVPGVAPTVPARSNPAGATMPHRPVDAVPSPAPVAAPAPPVMVPVDPGPVVISAPPAAIPSTQDDRGAAAAPAVDDLTGQVVQIVADLTGYPSELLDLDLDLEADLGVDTVKQAEVFATVRQRFQVPRDVLA